MKSVQVSAALTIACMFILGIGGGYAQSNLASVSGVVSDRNGAVVPAAAVSATNTATGVDTKTATDAAGFYAIRNLPIGAYTLTIEHPGFRRYLRQGMILTTGQSLGLDVGLELGEFSQTVNVTGEASLLETRTSDISNVVTSNSVEALPLANRLLLNLVQLSGAAVFVDSATLNTAPVFSLAGGRTGTPMAWLDGADIQNLRLGSGLITIDPPVDAIQEVKVLENNYSAEYGGSSGGVIVETTKSGTNQFHGSAYEFFRNDALDAAGYFAPVQSGAKLKPELRYNVFGGSIGGPIRRDRIFFFFAFEGDPLRQGNAPDTLDHAHCSATWWAIFPRRCVNSKGQLIPIYDPATTRVVNGEFVRDQFPGNIIPPDRIDPVAANVMNFYPLPNQPSPNLAGANNFSGNFLTGGPTNFFLIKADYARGANDRFSGWYINEDATPNNTSVFPDPAADSQTFSISNHHYGYGSWFHMFGPNKMNDLSATYTYRTAHALSFGLGGDYPSSCQVARRARRGLPQIRSFRLQRARLSPAGAPPISD